MLVELGHSYSVLDDLGTVVIALFSGESYNIKSETLVGE
jgi:hypothetical protein